MRKSARTQIPPFFDNDPYSEWKMHSAKYDNLDMYCVVCVYVCFVMLFNYV